MSLTENQKPYFHTAYNLAYRLTGTEQEAVCLIQLALASGDYSFEASMNRQKMLDIYQAFWEKRAEVPVCNLPRCPDQIQKALLKLDVASRFLVILRDLFGCTYQEIAAVTGLETGEIGAALNAARKNLSALLARLPAGHT